MSKDLTSKEAMFALDTTFDEDVKAIGEENTMLAIRYINSTPDLYNKVGGSITSAEMRLSCYGWAKSHNDEFGDLFITELDTVDWKKVRKMV